MAKRFLLTFLILSIVSSMVLLVGCFGSKAVTIGVAVPLSGEDKR